MDIARSVADLRMRVGGWRGLDQTVGLVPTMGAIHDGHLALVRAARAACDRVVTSLFVNPKQFGPTEDFGLYPRNEADDARLLSDEGVDLLFAPSVDHVYPEGFATTVAVAGLTEPLCGAYRPGHFDGVATVVSKLLIQCAPDRAYFGEKDYQQLLVVRRVARDLDLPVEIVAVPTVRDADGLALSSRNAYLSCAERAIAPVLYRTIAEMARRLADGRTGPAAEIEWGRARISEAGFDRLDYLEVRDAETLEALDAVTRPARVLVAAWLGPTRLIDNVPVLPRR